MLDVQVTLGNEADFNQFMNKFGRNDKVTLRSYWGIAKKKQQLLLIRRLGPRTSQILVIPLTYLPTLQKEKHFRTQTPHGFVGAPIQQGHYFVFGAMVQDQNEVGQLHAGNVEEATLDVVPRQFDQELKAEVLVKRRGRPKKDARPEVTL